jgi:DNA-binding winged helix-turn-helix (wHTH) protein
MGGVVLGRTSQADREDLKVGDLNISPSRRLVAGPAGTVSLEPLVLELLLLLAESGERVISRPRLFESLWNSPHIGDDSLNRLSAALRRALAQVGSSVQLETVPRAGYRLAGATPIDVETPKSRPMVTRRAWLAAGSAGLITAAGAGWWLLRPDSNASEGERLGALAERMLRFDVPGKRQHTVDMLAHATRLRPDDARLWGLLAYAKARLVSGGEGRPTMEKMLAAEDAIGKARALQPDEPNAELAMLMLGRSVRDWRAVDRALRKILARDPGNVHALSWLVALTQSSGHANESWRLNERQIALAPLSPEPLYRRALKLWIFGRVSEADLVIDPLLHLWPTHPWVWNARFMTLAFTGRAKAALTMLEDSAAPEPSSKPRITAQWKPTLAALDQPTPAAIRAAREANMAAAATSPGQAAHAVMALSALREVDAAFEVIRGFLLSEGSMVTRDARTEPVLLSAPTWRHTQWLFTPPTRNVRIDPRFPAFAAAIGLAEYWRERGPPDAFLTS